MVGTKDIETKKRPGRCEVERCREDSLFEERCCWIHLTEEERQAYVKRVERKIRKGESLKGDNLKCIDLAKKDLSKADLSGVNLFGANLYGANLSESHLTRANLFVADLTEANFSRADLTEANLSGADLTEANLSGADLSGANFSGADLTRANLTQANLSRSDLTRANLSWANLSEADLSGANLSGANLSGANLSEVEISAGIRLDEVLPHLVRMSGEGLKKIIGGEVIPSGEVKVSGVETPQHKTGTSDDDDEGIDPLAEEMAYFEEHKEEWLKDPKYSGRYVAIKGQEVICVKDTEDEIVEEVYGKGAVIKKRFVKGSELGDVLITQVTREVHKIFIYTTWMKDNGNCDK